MPVVQISCPGNNPQKALVSLDRYPTLSSFLHTLPTRFNLPHPSLKHAKQAASLTYLDNGQPYDITDDEGWIIALGEMEHQPKPTLVWTVHVKREREEEQATAATTVPVSVPLSVPFGIAGLGNGLGHVIAASDREGMDVLTQLLSQSSNNNNNNNTSNANGGAGTTVNDAVNAHSAGTTDHPSNSTTTTTTNTNNSNGPAPKRRRRSSKNPNIDGTVPPTSASPMKRQQQQTELYRRLSKEAGHAAAFDALDKSWQDRFYSLADIVQDIFGSRHYLLNPLEVACPLCLTCIKLSQICERRMGNLMHAQHHLRKVHYDSPLNIVRETAVALVARWEERFGAGKMVVTPITEDMRRCLRDIDGGRDGPSAMQFPPPASQPQPQTPQQQQPGVVNTIPQQQQQQHSQHPQHHHLLHQQQQHLSRVGVAVSDHPSQVLLSSTPQQQHAQPPVPQPNQPHQPDPVLSSLDSSSHQHAHHTHHAPPQQQQLQPQQQQDHQQQHQQHLHHQQLQNVALAVHHHQHPVSQQQGLGIVNGPFSHR
ncbi:hypothetical protein DFJ77DRAFT_32067 [Powellomyces hirtus]|nr:hypothetical protein DFJ77DRAFT_32067 [Powellomyces hirtus]